VLTIPTPAGSIAVPLQGATYQGILIVTVPTPSGPIAISSRPALPGEEVTVLPTAGGSIALQPNIWTEIELPAEEWALSFGSVLPDGSILLSNGNTVTIALLQNYGRTRTAIPLIGGSYLAWGWDAIAPDGYSMLIVFTRTGAYGGSWTGDLTIGLYLNGALQQTYTSVPGDPHELGPCPWGLTYFGSGRFLGFYGDGRLLSVYTASSPTVQAIATYPLSGTLQGPRIACPGGGTIIGIAPLGTLIPTANRIAISSDLGATWTVTTFETDYPGQLIDGTCTDGNGTVIGVGEAGDGLQARGAIFRSTDYGATWTRVFWLKDLVPTSRDDRFSSCVYCGNLTYVTVCERVMEVVISRDGGATWSRLTLDYSYLSGAYGGIQQIAYVGEYLYVIAIRQADDLPVLLRLYLPV
jgi:hypothetical protein